MNISSLRSLGVALLFAGALSGTASADLIVQYSAAGAPFDGSPVAPLDWADHITFTNLAPTAGSGITRVGSGAEIDFGPWGSTIDTAKYVSFKVSLDPGYQLTLSNLTFRAADSGSGGMTFQMGYRLDVNNDGDFADGAAESWNFGTLYSPGTTGQGRGTLFQNKVWDFGGSVATSGSVEFGLFGSGVSPVEDYVAATIFTVNGTVSAVPEPSTSGLVLSAGLAAIVLARRRKAISNS
jgi:hypothetical protein